MNKNELPPAHKYASCPNDGIILDYYENVFEAVYVLLHPFIRPLSIPHDRFTPENYPSKKEIIDGCEGVSWKEIMKLIDVESINKIDIGLRAIIGGISSEYVDVKVKEKLLDLQSNNKIILPDEGSIPDLLENKLYDALEFLGHYWLWVGDEHCTERKLYKTEKLKEEELANWANAIFTNEKELLIISHWDSHCTFLCSSRENIEKILEVESFEGFYADQDTEVVWGIEK